MFLFKKKLKTGHHLTHRANFMRLLRELKLWHIFFIFLAVQVAVQSPDVSHKCRLNHRSFPFVIFSSNLLIPNLMTERNMTHGGQLTHAPSHT